MLNKVEINKYSSCSFCGSINYISDRSAEDDNKDYFNSVYSKGSHCVDKKLALFSGFERFYTYFCHLRPTLRFCELTKKISETISNAEKVVEIGFGNGAELLKNLKRGVNIYGLDISHEAVKNFIVNNPEYRDKVFCDTSFKFPVDIVYSNALFEHLDDPGEFLTNANSMLNKNGKLIMRLPVVTFISDEINDVPDINLWKPCHRVLYSYEGLSMLFEKYGFKIVESAALAYYGYRVMNCMLRFGYRDIEHVRCPYYHIEGLNSDIIYLQILVKALFEKNRCSDFGLIAVKV